MAASRAARVTERLAVLVGNIGGFALRRCLRRARQQRARLMLASDDEVIAGCRRIISGPKLAGIDVRSRGSLLALWGELSDRDAEALAYATEAFARFPPAGLPPGTELYDEQLIAAAEMLRGALVQMDTGEGKTFAIAAAAFALLRVHERVYVVTANPYLAARDAAQTAPYWNRMGVSVSRVLPGEYADPNEDDWGARVVYTTLSTLAFRVLKEELGDVPVRNRFAAGALLLDEADAVLLEQSTRQLRVIRTVDASTKDWSVPLEIAQTLTASHVQADPFVEPSATLTPQGEAVVLARCRPGTTSVDRLMLLHDVELAYAALRVAREGHDYEVRGRTVVTLDATSGWHTPGFAPDWVAPLEQHLDLVRQPRDVPCHLTDGITLLRRFPHIAGTSGTIIGEALDYYLLLGLPPAVVPPRTPRRNGRLHDLMAKTKEHAHEWVVDQIIEHGLKRPIFVATDSTADALELAELARGRVPEGVTVRAVSGETIAEGRLFEQAGRPGMTIVSTRVAGRGVDIVLNDEARANGGAMLLAVGHSPEGRIDRQLLGRVGRRGDPYTARFIMYPQDPLARLLAPGMLQKVSRLIDDEPVGAKMLTRTLTSAQRRLHIARLAAFASSVAQGNATGGAYDLLRTWRRALGPTVDGPLPDAYLAFLAERYVATRFPGLAYDTAETFGEGRAVAAEVSAMLQRPEYETQLIVRTTGQPPAVVRQVIEECVEEALRSAVTKNESIRQDMRRRREERDRAELRRRLLRFASVEVERRRCGEAFSPESSLRHAVAVAEHGTADRIATRAYDDALRASVKPGLRRQVDDLDAELDELKGLDPHDEDFAPRVVAAVHAVSNEHHAATDALTLLETIIDRAEATHAAAVDALMPEPAPHAERSSWATAAETMTAVTQRFAMGLDRTKFQLRQSVSASRYPLAYAARTADLKRETEAALASETCANLIAAAQPGGLDDLFADREHRVVSPTLHFKLEIPTLPVPERDALPSEAAAPAPLPTAPVPAADEASLALVRHYVDAVQERLGKDAPDEDRLYPALLLVLSASPLTTMTDPDRVADAYAAWKRSEDRDRILPWQRRALDAHVTMFLNFLHERGLAAPLPEGVTERSMSLLRRARSAFKATGVTLGLIGLVLAAMVAAVLAVLPIDAGFTPAPALGVVDRLLTGGLLSAGSALGVALFGLMAAAWSGWLVGKPESQDPGVLGFERLVSSTAIVGLGLAVVAPWQSEGLLGVATAVSAWIILVGLSLLLRNATWGVERMIHCRLAAGLTAAFAVFAVLPYLSDVGGTSRLLLVAGVTAAVLAAGAPVRTARIAAVALRVDDAMPGGGETLAVRLPVRARLSAVQHSFALVFAWAISCVVIDGSATTRAVAASLTYLIVLTIWARVLAGSATEPEEWRGAMRFRNQAYEPTASHPTLEAALASARRTVLTREILAIVPGLVAATLVAATCPEPVLDAVPVGVAAICMAAVALALGGTFVRSLTAPFAAASAWSPSDAPDDHEGLGTIAQDVVSRLARKMTFFVVGVVALSRIADLLDVRDLLVSIFKWLAGLL